MILEYQTRTVEIIINKIVDGLHIDENTSIFDPACGSGNLILNCKVMKPDQVHGMDIDPLTMMCCQFNYYLKFGNNAPEPDIRCGNFAEFKMKSIANYDIVICNPPYGAEMEILDSLNSEVKSYFPRNCHQC